MSERDEWETPKWLFDILNEQYKFTVDCCANVKNTKVRSDFTHEFENFKMINHILWMNPPFSKANAMFKHFFKMTKCRGIAIYRCDNLETKVWQDIIFPNASWIFIPNKRIAYEGLEGKGSRFPSALIGYKTPRPKLIKGSLLIPANQETQQEVEIKEVAENKTQTEDSLYTYKNLSKKEGRGREE